MFRKGGSANNGIMDGLVDRKGYAQGPDNPWITEAREALRTDAPRDTSLSQMLIGGGLNLVSGAGAGEGLMSNVAKSYKGPSEEFFKQRRASSDYDRKVKQAAAQMGLEQKWKLEQLRAKDDPNRALYNVYLKKAIEEGMDGPAAERYATYQATTKRELENKVGGNRIADEVQTST